MWQQYLLAKSVAHSIHITGLCLQVFVSLTDKSMHRSAVRPLQIMRRCLPLPVQRNIKPQIRLGQEYQAAIPPLSEAKPKPAREPSARGGGRGGTLVPSVAAALASVRGPEKAAADALPLDAKMDPTESIGESHCGTAQWLLIVHSCQCRPSFYRSHAAEVMPTPRACHMRSAGGAPLDSALHCKIYCF